MRVSNVRPKMRGQCVLGVRGEGRGGEGAFERVVENM